MSGWREWMYLHEIADIGCHRERGPETGHVLRNWLLLGVLSPNTRVRLPEWERHVPLRALWRSPASAFVLPPAWPDLLDPEPPTCEQPPAVPMPLALMTAGSSVGNGGVGASPCTSPFHGNFSDGCRLPPRVIMPPLQKMFGEVGLLPPGGVPMRPGCNGLLPLFPLSANAQPSVALPPKLTPQAPVVTTPVASVASAALAIAPVRTSPSQQEAETLSEVNHSHRPVLTSDKLEAPVLAAGSGRSSCVAISPEVSFQSTKGVQVVMSVAQDARKTPRTPEPASCRSDRPPSQTPTAILLRPPNQGSRKACAHHEEENGKIQHPPIVKNLINAEVQHLLGAVNSALLAEDFDARVRQHLYALYGIGGMEVVTSALKLVGQTAANTERHKVKSWPAYILVLLKKLFQALARLDGRKLTSRGSKTPPGEVDLEQKETEEAAPKFRCESDGGSHEEKRR